MYSGVKYFLSNLIKDLHITTEAKVVILDRNNRILLVEGDKELSISDLFITDCAFDSDEIMSTGKARICIKNRCINFVDYEELRNNLQDVLEKFKVTLNDLNSIMIPIGSGSEALGTMIFFISDVIKGMGVKKFQYLINTIYLTTKLLVENNNFTSRMDIRPIEDVEKELMITALKRIGNSSYDINIISDKLGMNRSTFYRKCKKYNIDIQNVWS